MTQFNEPNRFCGGCSCYLAYKEPETTPEQNIKLLEYCKECKAWRQNGIQILNKDNIGQCWHCAHQTDFEEVYHTASHESVLVPYCNHRKLVIIANKDQDVCPFFKDRGGFSSW